MRRLYDVAAQLAVIERWDVLTEGKIDYNMDTTDLLLQEAAQIFAEQSEHWRADMRRYDELLALDESAFFDALYELQTEACKWLVLFAEQHILLVSRESPGDISLLIGTLQAWASAAMAMAKLVGAQEVMYDRWA